MWESVEGKAEGVKVPCARCKHAATWYDGAVYLLGGRNNNNLPLKDLWTYNLDKKEWKELVGEGEAPGCLQEHSLVAYKGRLYVFGGEVGFSSSDETPLWSYDIKASGSKLYEGCLDVTAGSSPQTLVVWKPLLSRFRSPDILGPLGKCRQLEFDTLLTIVRAFSSRLDAEERGTWMGVLMLHRKLNCRLESFHVIVHAVAACARWRKHSGRQGKKGSGKGKGKAERRPTGRRGHTANVYDKAMYICGGYQDLRGSSMDIWRYLFEEDRWEEVLVTKGEAATAPSPRHSHTAVVYDSYLWILGGMTNLVEKDDLWKLDLTCMRWSQVKGKTGPGPLHSHSAIKVLSSMLVYGGIRLGQPSSELWAFHFGTETWDRIHPGGDEKPLPRSHATVIFPYTSTSDEGREVVGYDPDLANVTAIFDTYNKDLQPVEHFVHTHCKHREPAGQARLYMFHNQSLSLEENEEDEEDNEEDRWYRDFKAKRMDGATGKRVSRVESFSSASQNLRFFKDLSRISQMSLSRITADRSYSALGDEDGDQLSLTSSLMSKSISMNGFASWRRSLPHEPNSVPSLSDIVGQMGTKGAPREPSLSLYSPTESYNSHQHVPIAGYTVRNGQPTQLINVEPCMTQTSFEQFTQMKPARTDMVKHGNNEDGFLIDLDILRREEPTSDYASVETDSDRSNTFGFDNPNYIGPESSVFYRRRRQNAEGENRTSRPRNGACASVSSSVRRAPHAELDEFTSHQNIFGIDAMSHHEDDLTSHNYSMEMHDLTSITSTELERELTRMYQGRPGTGPSDIPIQTSPHTFSSSKMTPLPIMEPTVVYVIGGKDTGQVVAFRRPIALWKLDLTKCLL
ncbi:unnamed protein product [Darwinula stevensoni]|uniref:Uncharacterized protein n=1 Tax=Darwinula stevensoni TaxID=69355 RepID=A0A7R8X5C7_9CRUS|nr:unnamed protein product [Darwinula stevensoni]CAG0886499.1 unnamed protein product [Darwinula stevensoni]